MGAASAHAFNLLEAWHAAQNYDANFTASRSTLEAGQEKIHQGRALLLPQASLTGSYVQNSTRQSSFLSPNNNTVTNGATRSYSFSLSQALFDISRYAKYRQGESETRLAEIHYAIAKQQLMVDVAQAFFDALLAQDTLAATQAAKKAYQIQVEQARAAFELGTATITDTYEAQAGYDGAVANEIVAQNTVVTSATTLTRLTGLPADTIQRLSDQFMFTLPPPEPLDIWLSRALSHSLEIKKQEQQLVLTGHELTEKRAYRFPSATLTANYQSNANNNPSWSNSPSGSNTSLGITVTFPLFAGGGINAQIREAVARQESHRYQLEAVQRKVQEDVKRRYIGVTNGIALIKAQERLLISVTSKLEATRIGKEVGIRTNIDLLKAEQDYTDTVKNLAEARYRYLNARIQLAQAVGILDETVLKSMNDLIQQ